MRVIDEQAFQILINGLATMDKWNHLIPALTTELQRFNILIEQQNELGARGLRAIAQLQERTAARTHKRGAARAAKSKVTK